MAIHRACARPVAHGARRRIEFLLLEIIAEKILRAMYPRLLIAILEKSDPSFRDLLYPKALRCRLEKRIVRAIEEHWPVYFPTRKECRGSNWSLSLPESDALYKPRPDSLQELERWKNSIAGTIVEMRAHGADISWKRFIAICQNNPGLRPFLSDFKPLANFLIYEESMWPRSGGVAVGMEEFFQGRIQALQAPGSPYPFSDPQRLRFLELKKPTIERIQMIELMRQLLDLPLMILAILQKCASESENSSLWLDLQNHITAIIKTPSPLAFRKTWLEHAMQMSGATKKSGKSCPRKWAKKLIAGKDDELDLINAKAVEVHGWLNGKKQPSVENIRRSWQATVFAKNLTPRQAEIGGGRWLFSWMISLWLETHFTEVAAEFKGETKEIQNYYRRFFHYLEIFHIAQKGKGAGGLFARQP
jgi:hypothetical protein